ncbi:MAG: phenylalanine--tRNA ligase subunit beta, partial [Actinomycetota bacterium]|nr:phenylalanine--tRNA ligase subunit beta [Actinomycetota bacterium]
TPRRAFDRAPVALLVGSAPGDCPARSLCWLDSGVHDMKVLLSWLREFADFDQDPELIGATLSDLGTPVEEVTRLGERLEGIVVARVLALRSHPNADKIQLVDVDAGDGEALQICCGAFNMVEGDLVPLATLGTVMPDGMKIERRKLRGEWSNGMLCSTRELGQGEDHGGIAILDADLQAGAPLAEALGVETDVLWDLEVNPNRPDAMSVAGIARDLAAAFGIPFTLPAPSVETGGAPARDLTTIEVEAPDGCGRFATSVLRNVVVGTSPEWMQERLTHLGMRPINALVDISNYVMLELGQPNHPYDLAKVPGGGLRVRRAGAGETLVTLDDVERPLTSDDLLICDAEDTPIGIAGIMGGAACEISEGTTEVLLEMAWFDPTSISRTSRRLGLRTEASARFDKGADPEMIDLAAARFCQLAAEICAATIAPGSVDVRGELPDRSPIRVRTARVNQLLGTDLEPGRIAELLAPIGFAATPVGHDHDVVVPSWRYDSSTEIDVVEEVARHHRYANIPSRELTAPRAGGLTARQRERREVRRLLAGRGYTECLPMPFLAPGQLERCGLPADGIEIANPLVAEESVLRPALRPGLIAACAHNATRRQTQVSLWEIGHVFLPPPPGQVLPDEREHVAVLLAGQEAPTAIEVWSALADLLRVEEPSVVNAEIGGLHPSRAAQLRVAGHVVGEAGEIDPDVLAAHDIAERVAWLEVDLGALLDGPRGDTAYRQVSRYPSSDIDLAFEVPDDVSALDVEHTLATASDLIWSARLFDVYRGPPVTAGARSLAYALRLQAIDHTLTDDEVAEVRRQAIDRVETAHHATLRA